MSRAVVRYYEDVELGDEIGPLTKTISDQAVAEFCQVSEAPTPNRFTDEDIAKKLGLSGPIVPGVMSMAIIAQFLTTSSAATSLKHLDLVFRQPVPHRPVILSAVITDKREEDGKYLVECDVYMRTEESGNLVGGKAILSLPSRGK